MRAASARDTYSTGRGDRERSEQGQDGGGGEDGPGGAFGIRLVLGEQQAPFGFADGFAMRKRFPAGGFGLRRARASTVVVGSQDALHSLGVRLDVMARLALCAPGVACPDRFHERLVLADHLARVLVLPLVGGQGHEVEA
ncbi:hypothetical protein SALBM311S_06916 [Streptomyces alboniger]